MKQVIFENRFNHDRVACHNPRDIETIDGVEYYKVHRFGQDRTFLMRKDSLVKVVDKDTKSTYNK